MKFRHVLDYLHDSFEIVGLDQLDDFLLEELNESSVALFPEFGVLVDEIFELSGERVDEVLRANVLHRHFHDLLAVVDDSRHSVSDFDLETFSFEDFVDEVFVFDVDSFAM